MEETTNAMAFDGINLQVCVCECVGGGMEWLAGYAMAVDDINLQVWVCMRECVCECV